MVSLPHLWDGFKMENQLLCISSWLHKCLETGTQWKRWTLPSLRALYILYYGVFLWVVHDCLTLDTAALPLRVPYIYSMLLLVSVRPVISILELALAVWDKWERWLGIYISVICIYSANIYWAPTMCQIMCTDRKRINQTQTSDFNKLIP